MLRALAVKQGLTSMHNRRVGRSLSSELVQWNGNLREQTRKAQMH